MGKGLKAVTKALNKAKLKDIEPTEWRNSVILQGKVKTWKEKVKAGYTAVGKGYKGVVNDIEVEGVNENNMFIPSYKDNELEGKHFDAVVIGGGVIGSSIARELSRYHISIALLDKEEDLAKHASSRNDGMVHPGFAPHAGSLKHKYNLRGNKLYEDVSKELDFDFKRVGSLIVYTSPLSKLVNPILFIKAKMNKVEGHYLNKHKVKQLEPYISDEQHGALFLPSAGLVSPYRVTIAYAENAVMNGAEVFFNTFVKGFEMDKNHIHHIKTNRGNLTAGVVINAAGVWSDRIAEYADDRFFSIHARKGADAILDIKTGKYQTRIAAFVKFSQLGEKSKGGGVITTVEGNLLVGPTAEEVPYREDYATTAKDMDYLLEKMKVNKALGKSHVITYFAGTRSCTYEEDFVIEPSEHVDNLVHVAGIQSPGLASAPAIALDASEMAVKVLSRFKEIKPNEKFNPIRKAPPELKRMSIEQRADFIKQNPAYGRIVCRCEEVSEGEIRDALNSTIPVNSLDGIKRRARISAGRCHGGFCTPRVMEIMAEKDSIHMTKIKKKGEGSELLVNETKGDIDYSGKNVKSLESEVK
jgi:glycerol-3-phosphate dehydrogenase